MAQADLDHLYALYADWLQRRGNFPEAIAVCDSLDMFIEAYIEDGQAPCLGGVSESGGYRASRWQIATRGLNGPAKLSSVFHAASPCLFVLKQL